MLYASDGVQFTIQDPGQGINRLWCTSRVGSGQVVSTWAAA
jgi:hypothetical protein